MPDHLRSAGETPWHQIDADPAYLTNEVRGRLADLALASELNSDIGASVRQVAEHLETWSLRDPDLASAVEMLRRKLGAWQAAHRLLAVYAMEHAQLCEDTAYVAGLPNGASSR